MVEIVAVVIGVALTALIGVKIAGYRNLITYEITSMAHDVAVRDGEIVPYDSAKDEWSTRIFSVNIKLVNRGWKNISDVKLHTDIGFEPFSVEKVASSISAGTISLEKIEGSVELYIGFLPSKEEVTVTFSTISKFSPFYKLTGAGSNYEVNSIHYYRGYQMALGVLKSLVSLAVLGGAAAVVISSI